MEGVPSSAEIDAIQLSRNPLKKRRQVQAVIDSIRESGIHLELIHPGVIQLEGSTVLVDRPTNGVFLGRQVLKNVALAAETLDGNEQLTVAHREEV